MSWTPPGHWVEVESQLKKSGQVTLDSNGNGVLTFDPDNARQRWVVEQVVVSTAQSSTATVVPQAIIALNTVTVATLSMGNQRGASWSGNQDTFTGNVDVSPADYLTVAFTCPAGQSPAALAGVVASAIVTGTKHTRRALCTD